MGPVLLAGYLLENFATKRARFFKKKGSKITNYLIIKSILLFVPFSEYRHPAYVGGRYSGFLVTYLVTIGSI